MKYNTRGQDVGGVWQGELEPVPKHVGSTRQRAALRVYLQANCFARARVSSACQACQPCKPFKPFKQ